MAESPRGSGENPDPDGAIAIVQEPANRQVTPLPLCARTPRKYYASRRIFFLPSEVPSLGKRNGSASLILFWLTSAEKV